MSDTYALVMRATEGPADRRTTRARAPRRSGVVRDAAEGTPAVAGIAADASGAPAAAQAADANSPAEGTFAAAVAAFMAGREAQRRQGLVFEDVPAPKRLAPYATAMAATVRRGEADVAWGRLVLLYDPDGPSVALMTRAYVSLISSHAAPYRFMPEHHVSRGLPDWMRPGCAGGNSAAERRDCAGVPRDSEESCGIRRPCWL